MVRTLRWEVILDFPGGPKVITMVLTREGGRRQRSEKGGRGRLVLLAIAGFTDGGRGHRPKNTFSRRWKK